MNEARELTDQIIAELQLWLAFKNDWQFMTPLQKNRFKGKLEELCYFSIRAAKNEERDSIMNKLNNFIQIERTGK